MKYSFQMNKETILVLTYSKKTGHRFASFLLKISLVHFKPLIS